MVKFFDSERSDECIDFTMLCVFFFMCVYTRTCRNNARISNFGGGFRFVIESSWCIGERREKPKKNDRKMGIFTQNQFSTKTIFLYGFNSKNNHCKNLKFSPNVYIKLIQERFGLTILFPYTYNTVNSTCWRKTEKSLF
ncbi:Uncharacterized protein FWK35_00014996 [Aphis craccivora]|uniref:Uncharacterized protein n=1 Tax=Aphis craccivora TaxID=307492 RepID=A0A6G0YSM2_APHCR|nr:Uncharacterized protein FWK35_00014996 [Aphis craccivora]